VLELKYKALTNGIPEQYEFRDGSAGGGRWYSMWIDADRAEDGSIAGVTTTIIDITDRKHREQTLRALLREVSHRSKNLLSIILSIATQTGRYSGTTDLFLKRFSGRIQSLASSQDLVTSSNWRGAMLSELVTEQVSRYREDFDRSVIREGVDVHLNPNAALHIGLALHELLINSMSHGALAQPYGHVFLNASLANLEGSGETSLVLTWTEKSPAVEADRVKRFGSVALERVVPISLDGKATFRIDGDRVEYRLEIPASNFETG
jgi:two-component sensor histidine kinase